MDYIKQLFCVAACNRGICHDNYNVDLHDNEERCSHIQDVDDDDLEDFHRIHISFNKLTCNYNKFYRWTAKPFYKLHIRDFMHSFRDLDVIYSSIMSYNEKIHVEQAPLGNFLKHLSQRVEWVHPVND